MRLGHTTTLPKITGHASAVHRGKLDKTVRICIISLYWTDDRKKHVTGADLHCSLLQRHRMNFEPGLDAGAGAGSGLHISPHVHQRVHQRVRLHPNYHTLEDCNSPCPPR